jgi:hypothetical protein
MQERRIPIVGWCGLHAAYSTVEKYREMAEAGFTHNLAGRDNDADMKKALDVAQAAGMKQFVRTPELDTDPAGMARKFKDHPANGGYFVQDEPGADEFDKLAGVVRAIQSVDSDHPCYVNLFPTYATVGRQLMAASYQDYVDQFIRKIPLPFVSFDHYCITTKGFHKDYFENLEIISRSAKAAGRPFWAFALCSAHWSYPPPALSHLRFQQFCNLAYGAQGLQYFTYITLNYPGWTAPGPVGLDGKPSWVYYLIKQVNEEIRNVEWVFYGSEVLSVGHTGKNIPQGTRPYEPAAPIKSVEMTGQGAVVSLLSRGKDRFLVIVNRDYEMVVDLKVVWDSKAGMAQVGKDGQARKLSGDSLAAQYEGGDMCILTWAARE